MTRTATAPEVKEICHGNLVVMEKLSKFSADMNRGQVVLESSNRNLPLAIEELSSADARNLAIKYAGMKGMGDARINGMHITPFPINKAGVPLEKVADVGGQKLPPQHELMQVARYRVEIPVTKKV